MIELLAPKGLGDALYLRAIVFYLLGRGDEVTVYTPWPAVFNDLPVKIRSIGEIDKAKDLRQAAYSRRNVETDENESLDQFRRACLRAGFTEHISLRIFWRTRNNGLLDNIRKLADDRKIMVYQPVKLARNPYQELLRPDVSVFNGFVESSTDYFRIKVGRSAFLPPESEFAPCDLDLVGLTSVPDVFDVASIADHIFCEPCFLVVLAEALGKPFTCMFSRKGLESDEPCVSDVNPKRIFNRPDLATAIYDG